MEKYNFKIKYSGAGVYCIKNLINEKSYIGSSGNILSRWRQHLRALEKGNHHSKILQRAYNKYGLENFEFIILEECEKSKNIIVELEQLYLDSKKPEYNCSPTAGSTLGYKHPPEFGEAISKRQLGKPSKLKGTKKDEEFKLKISKVTSGENNPFYGKNHLESTKKIITEKRKNQIMTNNKHIIQYVVNTGEIIKWKSLTEASKKTKLNFTGNISQACKGNKFLLGSIWFYEDDYNEEDLNKRLTTYKNIIKKVAQINPQTLEVIKIWESVKEAALNIGTYESCIRRSCKNGMKAKGYIWTYK